MAARSRRGLGGTCPSPESAWSPVLRGAPTRRRTRPRAKGRRDRGGPRVRARRRLSPRELAPEGRATGATCCSRNTLRARAPRPQNFPIRNRIIAGLSSGVVVVEASRRSGSLITARLAADFGRDVFAVPGSVFSETSAGTHELLRDGAILCRGAGGRPRRSFFPSIGVPRPCPREPPAAVAGLSHEARPARGARARRRGPPRTRFRRSGDLPAATVPRGPLRARSRRPRARGGPGTVRADGAGPRRPRCDAAGSRPRRVGRVPILATPLVPYESKIWPSWNTPILRSCLDLPFALSARIWQFPPPG